jgi:hypothetical protein
MALSVRFHPAARASFSTFTNTSPPVLGLFPALLRPRPSVSGIVAASTAED